MPGEISELAGTNVSTNQLQKNDIEMPDIVSTMNDYKTADVISNEGEQGDSKLVEVQDHDNSTGAQPKDGKTKMPTVVAVVIESNKKYHHGTQTELS